MESALLSTKLRIPPRPHRVVNRARLVNALDQGIHEHKLTLVSAPAGYGKTTLLAQWAQSSRAPVVWLSLSEDDNEIDIFLRYLLTAWADAQPVICDSSLGLLLDRALPELHVVLSLIVNVANTLTDPVVFVLDDFHLVRDPSIHHALTFMLDHLPPGFHFVLVVRADPPLPLAKYRARNQLIEFRADDLQFLPEDTAIFFSDVMGLSLAQEKAAALNAQLEGWIAGLQLAALTLQRHGAASDELVVSGKHRFIADYLSEDVLAHLSDDRRRFLLQTSILDSLCGSLCDAITGRDDSQEMLETLERENLFLVPLDDDRQWFRYHRLFADFLSEQLHRRHADEVAEIHRRAARWYLAQDMPEQAFIHARAGGDPELLVYIVERHVNSKLDAGEIRLVGQWVESLPDEWYAAYPMLGFAKVGFLAFTGDLDGCERCLDEMEQRLKHAQSESLRGEIVKVIATRCLLACIRHDMPSAVTYGEQALQLLPEEDPLYRPGVYRALGDTYRQHGRWEAAKEWYLKTLSVTNSPVVRVMMVHGYGALADLSLKQGRLRDAAGYWRKAFSTIQEQANWKRFPLPVVGWVYIRLGEILYEWNQLAEARDHLSRGLEHAELGGDVRAQIAGYLTACRVRLAEADIEAAGEYLDRARPLAENTAFPEWRSRFECCQLELWLGQGKLRQAIERSDELLRALAGEERPETESVQLAIAHVLIVKGDLSSLARALTVVERLYQQAEADGRARVVIESLALRALAHWKRDERADALTDLEMALRLAEPEGYIRLFADLGQPFARLLQAAHSRDVLPEYIERLLSAFHSDLAVNTPRLDVALQPLTSREQEILRLVAAGLTNREIASKLIVSAETVKKHSSSIYSKLGVRNRTEAVARARELNWLT